MKKKSCFAICMLLVCGIGMYVISKYAAKHNININGMSNSIIHAPYCEKGKIAAGSEGGTKVLADNSFNNKDNNQKQLSISYLRRINFGKYNFIMGWYGEDSIATAEDITSREVHVKNLNDDTEKIIKVDNNIIDYADKKFLIDSDDGFVIYDSSSNKKIDIEDIGGEQMPRFIDGNGKYVLMDKNKQYCIVEAETGKVLPIDARISDYEKPNMVTGYPAVTMSDDNKKFYFTRGREIRVSNIDNSKKSEKFAELPSEAQNAIYLRNIHNSNTMIVQLNCNDDTNGLSYYTINKDTNKFSKLKDIAFYDSLSGGNFVGNQNGNGNKIIYCERNKKSGMNFLYAGEIRDGKITKTKEIVLDGLSKHRLRNQWTWSASWNSTGSKIFIYVDAGEDEKFNAGFYADLD